MKNLINYKNLEGYTITKSSENNGAYNCYSNIKIKGLMFGHHLFITINSQMFNETGLINGLKYSLSEPKFSHSKAIHYNNDAKITVYQEHIIVETSWQHLKEKFPLRTFTEIKDAINYFNSIKNNHVS